jgi:lysophospholipase L1-like esterase
MSFFIQKKQRILMIGDSTMSIKEEKAFPENGWGMALEKFCNKSTALYNYARNGRSTKSFINEGLWDKVNQNIEAGDFVIIQFGHNDEKSKDTLRYTVPQTTYKENLRRFINDTRKKGGLPILCSPIVRRQFDKEGKLINTHGAYPEAVRELAIETNVPLIDLEKLTSEIVGELGLEKSKKLFMVLAPHEYPNFPSGKEDNTHLQVEGAKIVAELFVNDIKNQKLPLVSAFK